LPIASLLLKHTYRVSDEGLRARWVHEPYRQHFSGEAFLRGLDRCPADDADGRPIDRRPRQAFELRPSGVGENGLPSALGNKAFRDSRSACCAFRGRSLNSL